jgi:predicted HicB family RNase H-like nuclease
MGYNGYTEKKKASNKKYLDKLTRLYIWLTPEEKRIIEKEAADAGISINQLVKNRLFDRE